MKAKIFDLEGNAVKEMELPLHFNEYIRDDVIKRAVYVIQMSRRQKYGSYSEAGKRHSVRLSKRRRDFRTSYGYGISRTPRKVMWRRGRRFYWIGAFSPHTVGGRRAHPPKPEKNWNRKLNAKEGYLAVRIGLSASANPEYVNKRHKYNGPLPIIFENSIENIKKTKEMVNILKKVNLEEELKRLEVKKIRAGKGKMRNRKYKIRKGPLLIFNNDNGISKAVNNIPGFDAVNVRRLNAELLAPGTHLGRLTIWSENAINTLKNEKLYLR